MIEPPYEKPTMERLSEELLEANDALRSAYAIVERKGASTNWDGFGKRVMKLLVSQHGLVNALKGYTVPAAPEDEHPLLQMGEDLR